jgi:hypothetical protein
VVKCILDVGTRLSETQINTIATKRAFTTRMMCPFMNLILLTMVLMLQAIKPFSQHGVLHGSHDLISEMETRPLWA